MHDAKYCEFSKPITVSHPQALDALIYLTKSRFGDIVNRIIVKKKSLRTAPLGSLKFINFCYILVLIDLSTK